MRTLLLEIFKNHGSEPISSPDAVATVLAKDRTYDVASLRSEVNRLKKDKLIVARGPNPNGRGMMYAYVSPLNGGRHVGA